MKTPLCDTAVRFNAGDNNHTVSEESDTNVAHYNFDAYQPILIIFCRDVAERACYQMVICYPASPK